MLCHCFSFPVGIPPPKRSAFYFRLFAVYKQPFNLSQSYKANCILFAERDCTKRNLLVCPSVAFKSERGGLLQNVTEYQKSI